MSSKSFKEVPIMKIPDRNSGKLVRKLWTSIENKYHVKFADFWEFHKWTTNNLCEFWAEMWDFTEVIASKKFDKVVDLSTPMREAPEWFSGAKLNMAENLLKFRDEHIALICVGESRKPPERITYAQMYDEAKAYADAFRKCGLRKGDRVAGYISNRKEPVFAMHAVTSIGAIWSAIFPLLGSKVVINRFKQIEPKILFSIDSFIDNGKVINMLPKLQEIGKGLPSLEKVIIVSSKDNPISKNIKSIKNSCYLDEFLEIGRSDEAFPDMEFEQVPFSHPTFISFTSGTTGMPKALIHGFGSILASSRDFWLHSDLSRDSVLFCTIAPGGVTWNMVILLTFVGMTLVLYEGVPYFLSPTSMWDIVDKFSVSHLNLPANILEEFHKRRLIPGKMNHLSTLKGIIAGGSIVKPAVYDFVYEKVKKDITFSAFYGSTEFMVMCLVPDQTLPIYKGEIPTSSFGYNIVCVDESGKSILGQVGDLLIKTPSPCLSSGLWGDHDKSLFKKYYFSKYSDKFAIGDFGIINPVTKGFRIYGRSDETLHQRGTRFGSIDIYNILDNIQEIEDSICVTQYSKERDSRVVLFIKMKENELFSETLIGKVKQFIKKELTEVHVPEVILEVPDIPYNLNGKKMEIVLKKMINNMPYNAETIANPECLKYFLNVPAFEAS